MKWQSGSGRSLNNMDLPKRKNNRLKKYDYSTNGAYFITICTKNRRCLLSTIVGATIGRPSSVVLTSAGMATEKAICQISSKYVAVFVDHYVIMPNHIHILLSIQRECGRPMVAPTISTVVQQMKGYVTKILGRNIWQKSFHDHIIRSQSDYDKIWQYIDTNPLRWEQDCFYTEE